jgi:hypothetical protein
MTMPQQAYVAQQLWPSLPALLADASEVGSRARPAAAPRTPAYQELRYWAPSRPVVGALLLMVVLVFAGAFCYWDRRLERDHFSPTLAEEFYYATFTLEEDPFAVQSWYAEPPWTGRVAVEQLVHRISYMSSDMTYADAMEAAIELAEVEQAGSLPYLWRITFPPLPEVNVGRTEWLIDETGGFQYDNAQADKVVHCAGASLFYDEVRDKPVDLTQNERELPCTD